MHRVVFLVVVLAVITIGGVVYNHTREERWRTMPDGSEIRFLSVTYEQPPTVHFKTKQSFLAPFLNWLSPQWRYRFVEDPFDVGGSLNQPEVCVWFRVRGDRYRRDYAPSDVACLLIQNDQFMEVRSLLMSTRPGGALIGVGFDSGFCTEPRLKVRWSRDQQTMEFDIANPFYTGSLPITPEPKPRTP